MRICKIIITEIYLDAECMSPVGTVSLRASDECLRAFNRFHKDEKGFGFIQVMLT